MIGFVVSKTKVKVLILKSCLCKWWEICLIVQIMSSWKVIA